MISDIVSFEEDRILGEFVDSLGNARSVLCAAVRFPNADRPEKFRDSPIGAPL